MADVSVSAQLLIAIRDARAQAAQGDPLGGLELLDQALEAATMTLGADHPDVISAGRELAARHRQTGGLAEARRVLEAALAAGERGLGDSHPVLLAVTHDLARLADELGNRHEARRNYERLARLGPPVLGEHHDYVLAAYQYLSASAAPQPQPAAGGWGYRPQSGSDQSAGLPQVVDHLPRWTGQPEPAPADRDPAAELFAAPIYRPDPEHPPIHRPGSEGAPPGFTGLAPISPGFTDLAPISPGFTDLAPISPAPFDPTDSRQQSRLGLLVLISIAALALVGGGVAVAMVLGARADRPVVGQPDSGGTATSAAAGTGGPSGSGQPGDPDRSGGGAPVKDAPKDLKLADSGTAITLTWTDPGGGQAQFIVAGGQGTDLRPLRTLRETTFTVNGLNPRLEYCFTVAAVYDTTRVAVSDLACTARAR